MFRATIRVPVLETTTVTLLVTGLPVVPYAVIVYVVVA